MKVVRASVLGYCMGVKRAVESAEKALSTPRTSGSVYTLGPLIHNPSVLASLSERGLSVLDVKDIANLTPEDRVIIRAHGTTPQIEACIKKTGASVIDATCPRVHVSQRRASEWSDKGCAIIIAGDKNHGEVTSIGSYAKGQCFVVQTPEEAEKLDLPPKAVLLAQTTFSPDQFSKIASILTKKNPTLTVFDSICTATLERQRALRLLSPVDGIIVIGGRNSANTRRLYESALTLAPCACLIETEAEIPANFFKLETVALTAGASTPDSVIDAVEKTLLSSALK